MQGHQKKNNGFFNFSFISMTGSYFLGVFNDNFFKQSVMLLAVAVGMKELQGVATLAFTLPYILFASPAGWLADRFQKKNIVITAKFMEVIAMCAGALGLILFHPADSVYSLTWVLFFIMIGIMGLHACIFSPALNGTIPELFPEKDVTKVNGIIKSAVTIAILLGIAGAGMILDTKETFSKPGFTSLHLIAVFIISVALIGLFFSFWIKKPPHRPEKTTEKFPWLGIIQSIKDVYELKKDKLLRIAIWSNTIFWFMGILLVSLINEMGFQFSWGETKTSLVIAMQMIGVAVGSVLTNTLTKNRRWYRTLVPALFIMGICLYFMIFSPWIPEPYRYFSTAFLIFISGLSGGLYMIPLESFIQIRPSGTEKGKIIACGNFMSLSAVSLGGLFYYVLSSLKISLPHWFVILGSMNFVVAVFLFLALAKEENRQNTLYHGGKTILDKIVAILAKILLSIRYKTQVNGLEEILKKGSSKIIFLPNHDAYTDPLIIFKTLYKKFNPRSVAVESVLTHPVANWIAQRLGAIKIPDVGQRGFGAKEEVEEAIHKSIEILENGENLLLYPSGRVKLQKDEIIGSNSSVDTIISKVQNVRIVLVRQRGLWGSSFSWGAGTAPGLPKGIFLKILLNFIFFMPKRRINIEFYEPKDFPVHGTLLEKNRYLEKFYNENQMPNTYVPYSIWERGKERIIPEPVFEAKETNIDGIPDSIKLSVINYLKEKTGIDSIQEKSHLNYDLGMDSLMIGECILWLGNEFGFSGGDPDSFQTAGDLILAAAGQGIAKSQSKIVPPSKKWKKNAKNKILFIPKGNNVAEVFLKKAKENPEKIIIADQISGEKSYRDLILAILVLRPVIKKIQGERLGLMFPAGVGANIFYLAAIFSEKIPVMVNWTAGIKNVKASLDNCEVAKIVTSKTLINKLKNQGVDLTGMEEYFVYIEDFKDKISLFSKLRSLVLSKTCWALLKKAKIKDVAAILFTSGSETVPKSVPLSHENILTNIQDLNKVINLYETDVMMGFLPPFHSFGLSVTSIFPLCLGMPTIYHSNPTESKLIGSLAGLYQVSLLISTPTFLQGIMNASDKKDLETFRVVVTGAEKCPENLYSAIEQKCPKAKILEGYGITECSPVVSVNDENYPVKQTIGKILPSVEYIILNHETHLPCRVYEQGMLYVAGKSIFNGYINYPHSPFVEIDGKLWYKTGDIVSEDENHVLTFHARLKRFVKIGGEMVSLPAVEDVLKKKYESHDSKEPQIAVEALEGEGVPELILICIQNLDRKEVNETIRDSGLSAIHNIKQVIKLDSIPVLGTGKIDYRNLKIIVQERIKK